MRKLDFASEFDVRSPVMEAYSLSTSNTLFYPRDRCFGISYPKGDVASQAGEWARVRTYEAGFPVLFRVKTPGETEEERFIFESTVFYTSIVQNVLVGTMVSPYMESSDWKRYFTGRFRGLAEKVKVLRQAAASENASEAVKAFLSKSLLLDITHLLTETGGDLDKYREQAETLSRDTADIARGLGVEARGLTEYFSSVLRIYLDMDPLKPSLKTVESDIESLGNSVLPKRYYAYVNKHRSSPIKAETVDGIEINMWSAEFFRR